MTSTTASSTASPDEIARFTAIADAWWDPVGDFAPLHRLNPLRLEFIRDHLCHHFDRDPMAAGPLTGLDIIDIGCGGGILAEPMCRLGGSVTGIDAGQENIDIARHHAELSDLHITYRHQLPEDLGVDKDRYDVVLNMEVVEHVTDLDAFLAAAASLVKPGGVMVASTLNRTLKSLALAKVGAEYILRWVPAGTHDWKKFVRPSELAAGLEPCGVTVTDLKGMTYNPVTGDWSFSRDLDVNYLAFAVKA
ncbi:MAG: bifunctional 2-polyprenyl-6-hydroxyphenol methylase/3-demethylubiquinol 3-O-methyltransferase UbiG [Alphaproteobacteria bacterium]|nr:bifunctional 2-polyprenyl-6-hydroxyphenol methylase/3-demethylubiquinol 3-O-methyltransferase UbiG [Alphaproteobacteria bacterium]MBT7943767.1 bifunctional 2-polyprenyl-6-hydroxyphenol methylase/3-demethylubiquinol 3-O-methyltransferase UbiG [Alphaproteobacteria bacterium]